MRAFSFIALLVLFESCIAVEASPGVSSSSYDSDRFALATSRKGKTADNYVSSGLKNWDAGKLDRALADFNTAIQLEPKSTSARSYRGSLYLEENRLNEAIGDFDVTIREDPNDLDTYLWRGNAQAKARRNLFIR